MADVQASWLAVARRELQEWPLFGGRGDIQSAIEDYSQLLQRNKSCEVCLFAVPVFRLLASQKGNQPQCKGRKQCKQYCI